MTRRGLLLLTLATSVIAGACSGGDDPDEAAIETTTSTSRSVVTTAPTTSASATTPTTTSAPTTAAPSTTNAPPTEPPVTDTAPPTFVDMTQVEQDVIDDAIQSWQTYMDAARDPENPDKLEAMTRHLTGRALELAVANIADLAAGGLIAVENPRAPAAVDVFRETVTVDLDAGTASLEWCRIGSDLGVEPGGNPDGTDRVVIDEVNAYREITNLVLVDGTWIYESGTVIAKLEGTSSCAP